MRDACFDALNELENSRRIVCVDRAGQPISHRICGLYRLIKVLHAEDAQHWAENFLLSDSTFCANLIEDRRRHIISLVIFAARQPMTAGQQLSFLLADFDIFQDHIHLRFQRKAPFRPPDQGHCPA